MISPTDTSIESVEDLLAAFDPGSILFHGSGLLVVDKPAGVPVHRGTKHDYGLSEIISDWAHLNPGIIEIRRGQSAHPMHRLDREASGVLLLGTTAAVRRRCQKAISERRVRKFYLTFVCGPVDVEGEIRGRVRSKMRGVYRSMRAGLSFQRLAGDERLSLVRVRSHEGYTHQIRSLFAQAGRPVAGDLRYGKPKPSRQFLEKFGIGHLLLHAASLTLPGEVLGASRTFFAPLPETFLRVAREKDWDIDAILAACSVEPDPVPEVNRRPPTRAVARQTERKGGRPRHGKSSARKSEGKPRARKPTGKPGARKPDGKPRARKPEEKPRARKPTGKPGARKPDGKPRARKPDGKPLGRHRRQRRSSSADR